VAGSTPFYDQSRKADLARYEAKERDPKTTEEELKVLDRNKYSFRDQAHFESVQKTREKLIEATQRGDAAKVAQYSGELEKADKALGVYDANRR